MKFYLILLNVIFVLACSQDTPDLTAEESLEISQIGQRAAIELMGSLKSALLSAIEDSGIVKAISVCNVRAPELAEDIASGSERIIRIGRTSRKTRNKNNSPDAADLEAIRYFEELMKSAADSLPASYATRENQNYRYYQPIFMQALCLNCHGTQKTISEQVREKIRNYYPADQAVGYATGDLRAVFRVIISGK